MTANISGGHLNPAVTMSTLLCGFYVRARHVGPEGCWTYVGVAYQQADMRMNQQPLSHWFTHWMSINDICCRRRCHALQPLVHSFLYIALQVGAPAVVVVAAVVCRESSNAQLSMTARAHHNPKPSSACHSSLTPAAYAHRSVVLSLDHCSQQHWCLVLPSTWAQTDLGALDICTQRSLVPSTLVGCGRATP